MKTIFIVLFCILFLASCMKDEVEFSCDPVLNEYVTTHQKEIVRLSINDLATSDLQFQQAAFRSYDPVKKREVWLQKIQFLLDNEKYSYAEFAHVNNLLSHLNENYFTQENIESQGNERALFASMWINYAKNSLGWTDRYIAFVVYRLYTNQAQFDLELNALTSVQQQTSANSETGSCTCNTYHDFCLDILSCSTGICHISSGCGWFLAETCNGVCPSM